MLWLDVGRTDKGSRADTRVSIVRKIDKHPCQWLDNGMSNVLTDTKIANSLYCHIYIRWLQNDWSVRECSRKAKELFNENISYEAFRQYKLAMSSDEIVPDLFAKHIGNQDLDINEEKILMQQIIILKQRIFKAMESESKTPAMLLLKDNRVDSLMRQLTDIVVKLANIRGKGVSLINVRTTVNQQFNKVSNGQATISSSDEELEQWFEGIIQEAEYKTTRTASY